MRLSLEELRNIIQEEAHAMAGEEEAQVADAPPAEAEVAPSEAEAAEAALPEPSEEARAVVQKLGLSAERDASGEQSLGSSFAGLLTLVESRAKGSLDKLSEPANVARMIQAMGDWMTLEVLDIVSVEIEGMPTKEEFLSNLAKKA
jgi:hypothetical protein